MSEEGGGKIKSKRQHGPSKPYERRKSLLGKVKDLITPSWLSNLVTTVKQPEESESIKNDHKFMVPEMSPPQNRLKHHQNDMRPPPVFVPLDKRNGTPSKTMAPPQSTIVANSKQGESFPTLRQDQVPLQLGFTSSQLPLIPEKVFDHHHHHEDNDDNISDQSDHSKSTSGCSSMIPHPPSTSQKERVMLELNESDLSSIKDKLIDSNEKTQSKVGRSLTWSAQYNTKRPKKPALIGKPSFDVSLFGSPVTGGSTSLLSDRLHESTFYPGRTTFGGAASQRRQSLGTTAPYQSSPFPVRQKMKAKPMNNSFTNNATTSGTARKILETLEKMTTPLGDARKIPVDDTVMQSLGSSFSFTPSSYRRPSRHSIGSYMNSSREIQIPSKGPPLQKVSTPGSASQAINLQRYNTPDAASSTDTTSSYQLPGSSQRDQSTPVSSFQGGKMKSKKFSQHVPSSRKEEEEEQPYIIPQLRTDFTLPVKDMPSFNFNMPKSAPQSRTDSSSLQYTFSSPLQKMPVTPTDTPTGPPKMEFKFSSPIQGDGSTSPHKTKSVTFNLGEDNSPMKFKTPVSNDIRSSTISQGFSRSVTQSSSDSNSSFSGGLKAATELKSGSVMDILGKSETSLSKSSTEASPKKNDLSQFASKGWTCDVCLVSNKEDMDKCVACTTPKPAAKTSLPKNDSLSKFAAKGWTCDACLVSNKDDADKCVACTNPKPGLKKSKSLSASGDSLQSMFKKPTGNWDCDVCLVPNKGEVTKCIACESPRPGTQPSSSGGFKIAPGAFSGQSGFVLPPASNSNSNSGFSIGGDSKATTQSGTGFKFGGESTNQSGTGFKFGGESVKQSGTGFKFGGESTTSSGTGFKFGSEPAASTGSGFKFGDSSIKSSDETDTPKSGTVVENSVSDLKDKPSTGGFVFGNSLSSAVNKSSDSPKKSADDKPKSALQNLTDNKSLGGGFSFGKPNSLLGTQDKQGTTVKEDKVTLDNDTKLSVTTSTIATTGLAFSSKSVSKTATSTIPGGFSFGQSASQSNMSTGTGQNSANGGFVFGQNLSSVKDSSSDLKTSTVNSVFGSSSKVNNSNSIFGSDPKMSINSFSGTNNSGFSFNKQEEKKESENKPLFNSQPSSVSPSLKRGRDEESGSKDVKKPFAPSSTSASSSLFQFGAKTTASTSAPTGDFTFGQNVDKQAPFAAATTFNFGGTSTTSSTTGFNAVPQTTSSIFNANGPSLSTGAVFGNTASVTSSSTGSTFVFGGSSAKPTTSTTSATFGTTQQTSSIFGNNASSFGSTTTPAFGSSGSTSSFNSAVTSTGGFGSSTPSFGTTATNSPFGAPQTTTIHGFGAQQPTVPAFGTGQATAPAFGTPQTSSGPAFGLSQTPSFGAATPLTSTSAPPPGGFNFSATPSFNFGQSAAPAAPPAASVFQFGGSKQAETPQQPVAAAPAGGAPFSFSTSSTSSFGGTAGFGQPSTPQQPGMFNIGAGGSDNRKIKRAVRKIKR